MTDTKPDSGHDGHRHGPGGAHAPADSSRAFAIEQPAAVMVTK